MRTVSSAPELPTEEDVARAQQPVSVAALSTPVLPLPGAAGRTLDLKAECLQPTGSFKIRGATAAFAARAAEHPGPLVTVSAGNMGRAVAYVAAENDRPCRVYVPDHAPQAKLAPMEALGATIEKMPFDEWWSIVESARSPTPDGLFIHPFLDREVMAGNGTIALEILARDPYDAVLVPWGGGGLSLGIANVLRDRTPETKVFAVEVATAAPLQAAWKAGQPVTVPYEATFVDGIGATSVLQPMWDRARDLLAGVVTVTLEQAAEGIRVAARDAHVMLEGAAGCAVAAGLDDRFEGQRVLAIGSGGNIDPQVLATILTEER